MRRVERLAVDVRADGQGPVFAVDVLVQPADDLDEYKVAMMRPDGTVVFLGTVTPQYNEYWARDPWDAEIAQGQELGAVALSLLAPANIDIVDTPARPAWRYPIIDGAVRRGDRRVLGASAT